MLVSGVRSSWETVEMKASLARSSSSSRRTDSRCCSKACTCISETTRSWRDALADRELARLPAARRDRLEQQPADHLVADGDGHRGEGAYAERVEDLGGPGSVETGVVAPPLPRESAKAPTRWVVHSRGLLVFVCLGLCRQALALLVLLRLPRCPGAGSTGTSSNAPAASSAVDIKGYPDLKRSRTAQRLAENCQ